MKDKEPKRLDKFTYPDEEKAEKENSIKEKYLENL